jgi:hypothetical protein
VHARQPGGVMDVSSPVPYETLERGSRGVLPRGRCNVGWDGLPPGLLYNGIFAVVSAGAPPGATHRLDAECHSGVYGI